MSFRENVLKIVKKIPKGETLSYKEVARKSGSPNAYRAVGTILSKNYDKKIPCHRVIKSNGQTGQYNRGEKQKISILKKEGAIS